MSMSDEIKEKAKEHEKPKAYERPKAMPTYIPRKGNRQDDPRYIKMMMEKRKNGQ